MSAQPELFEKELRWIMLSLMPPYYEELCNNQKKFEYRRGKFITQASRAFVYCSSPVMEVGAYVEFGEPITGTPHDIAQIKEQEVSGSYDMMMEWMEGFSEASAVPVKKVSTFSPVGLAELRNHFAGFHPPQRFIYLDKPKCQDLLEHLKEVSGIR